MRTPELFLSTHCREFNSSLRVFGLLCFVFVATLSKVSGQSLAISGKVTDATDGRPLPGVSVMVKGTNEGTVTDNEGKYQLTLPELSSSLQFSFVGMVTIEVVPGERSVVDIQLEQDVRQLQEIVVSALAIEKDRDKVGSASSQISGSQVVRSGEPTLINSMSGKSSGLIINRMAGDPGAGSYIQIRGQSSIQGSVQPLIVVDGIPVYNTNFGTGAQAGIVEQSRLNDLNPNDIESIEVLKGASASALWGTRAGNGVIMITTKKGKSMGNKVNIEYSGTYSIDQLLTKHPLQNKYGQGTKGAYRTDVFNIGSTGFANSFGDRIADRPGGADSVSTISGYFRTPDGRIIYPIVEKRSRQTFDPYDAVYGNGHYYDQTLSISGGDRNANYYISIGDLDQKGIVKNNSTYRRTSFRVNTERQMNDWLRFGSNLTYSRMSQQGILFGNSINAVMFGLRTPPDWDNSQGYEGVYFQPNGTAVINRQLAYRNQIGSAANPGYDNPLWSMNNEKHTSEVDRFIGSMQMELAPVDWLSFTLRGGVDHYSERLTFIAPVGTAGGNNPGRLSLVTTRETQFNLDGFATGRFNLGSDWKGNVLVGINLNQRTLDGVGGSITNFTIVSNPPLSLDNTTATFDDPFNSYNQIRTSALYGTADFDFKDQVFIGLTGRMEKSSVFSHSSNPSFFYPSITASWHPLKTMGISNSTLTFLKLRAGYGVVSTTPGPYQTVTYWNPSGISDGFTGLNSAAATYGGGYQESVIQGNPDLKPETKTEVEGGFDLRIINDRIRVSATYFTNTVEDLIINVAMAGSTGFTSRSANVAEIVNRGIELDLSGDVVKLGQFTWNVYGNWTRIRNKVTYLGGADVVTFGSSGLGPGSAVVGHPIGIHYGADYEREGNGYALDAIGFPKVSATASVVGNPNPDWRLGIGTKISWKSLSLNVLVEHSHGGQNHGGTRGALIAFGTHKDTDHEVTLTNTQANTIKNALGQTAAGYGYKMNPDSSYTVRGYLQDFGGGPVLVDEEWWKGKGGGFATGSPLAPFIEAAQWTKLREVSLSYSLNSPGFQKRTKLKSVDFTITGRNLFLWTEFKGNDPESNLRGPANTQGRDYFNNPATRSFLFSIRVSY